jgi:hypothetical protein
MLATLALLASGLFTGAAAYINAVEQPARLQLADGALLAEWKVAYRRGTLMQASLAVLGGVLGAAAFLFEGRNTIALLGGALMIASWPWTALVVMPTNKALMAADPERSGRRERTLVRRWARLHGARTAFGVLACACFAFLLI